MPSFKNDQTGACNRSGGADVSETAAPAPYSGTGIAERCSWRCSVVSRRDQRPVVSSSSEATGRPPKEMEMLRSLYTMLDYHIAATDGELRASPGLSLRRRKLDRGLSRS